MQNIKKLFQTVKFDSDCYLIPGYVSTTADMESLFENMLLEPRCYEIKEVKDIKNVEQLPIDNSFKAGQYTVYFCIVDSMYLFLDEIGCKPVETNLGSAFDVDEYERIDLLKNRFPGIHAFLQRDKCICVAFIAK